MKTRYSQDSINGGNIEFDWSDSTDASGVAGYKIVIINMTDNSISNLFATDSNISTLVSPYLGKKLYCYIQAEDSFGNLSSSASLLLTITAEVTPPSTPTSLTQVVNPDSIDFSWNASSDDSGIAHYEIAVSDSSDFSKIVFTSNPASTSISSGLWAYGVTNYWKVRAQDISGNVSGWSEVKSFEGPPDTTLPSVPSDISAIVNPLSIDFDWSDSTDGAGIDHYEIVISDSSSFSELAFSGSPTDSNISADAWAYNATNYFKIRALDKSGNASNWTEVQTFTGPPDTTPPSIPTDLTYSINGENIEFDWSDSTDASGVAGYEIKINNITDSSTSTSSTTDSNISTSILPCFDTTLSWSVRAQDTFGNWSDWSTSTECIIPPDTVPPSVPTGLSQVANPGSIDFNWNDSTDSSSVAGYEILLSGSSDFSTIIFSDSTGTSNANSTKWGSGINYWKVRAQDINGNWSDWSTASEFSASDTIVPSIPGGLGKTGVNLTWNPASDVGSGIKNYIVQYADNADFNNPKSKETNTNSIAFSAMNLTKHNYYWHVKAVDNADNESAFSAAIFFTVTDSNETAKLSESSYANFAYSVSISSDNMVVGADGKAYAYRWNGASHDKYELAASGGGSANSVSISGDNVAIGVQNADDKGTDSGSVYAYRWNGTSYDEHKLHALDGSQGDRLGASVSVSGDSVAVGVCGDDDRGLNSGSVYVYRWYALGNKYEGYKLTASDGASHDNFGCSLAVSDAGVVVGADQDDDNGEDSGSIYIYRWAGKFYKEITKLTASDGAAGDNFGVSVAVSENNVVVGAPKADGKGVDSGKAYVYRWNGSSYTEYKLSASDGAAYDDFGCSVAISGNHVAVGASNDDDNGSNSGSIYIYNWNGVGYSEVRKLIASNGAANEKFGTSISLSGNKLIAGAKYGSSVNNAYTYTLEEFIHPTMPGTPSGLSVKIPAAGKTAVLDWDDSLKATEYKIQVDNNSDFSSPEFDSTSSESTITVSGMGNDAIYYWRVKAFNEYIASDWALGESFLIAPNDDSFSTATLIDISSDYTNHDYVGIRDAVDFYKFTVASAGTFTFSLTGLTSKASFNIYSEYDHKGTTRYRKLKGTSARYNKATGKTEATIDNILLDTGNYYVEVLSGDKGKGRYNTAYDLNISCVNFQVATTDEFDFKTGVGTPNPMTLDINADASASGWVGFGDAQDVFKFTVNSAGNFSFALEDLSSNASFNLYSEYDHKGTTKYKKLKGANAKYNKATGKTVASFDNVLLDTGNYYIEVLSGDKGKGRHNTSYNLNVTGEYFPAATVDEFDFKTGAGTPALINADEIIHGWVGFGDAQDVYKFIVSNTGSFNLSLQELSSQCALNIYYEYDNKGTTRYKKIKGTKSKYDKTTGKTSALLSGIQLDAGTYYIEVLSGDKGKGKANTEYDLKIEAAN